MSRDVTLPPAESPLRFDDLPSLSDIDSEEEEEQQEQQEFDYQSILGSTLESLRTTRCICHTSTTHHQGRAVVSSSDNDNDGGASVAARGGRATGGDDVDWEDIQEDEE